MSKNPRSRYLFFGTILLVSGTAAQTPQPRTDEFQINTTIGTATAPSAAMSADADFIVVWQSTASPGDDASGTSILGQRFASTGSKTDEEFQVNVATAGDQDQADVAFGADGTFVVVWRSFVENVFYGDTTTIQGRRFLGDGSPIGDEFQVNTYTTGPQATPRVAVQADGSFVVVWESSSSSGTDDSLSSIQSRFFSSDGSAIGDEFQVNTATFGKQRHGEPTVGASDGTVFVTWTDEPEGTLGQRYTHDAVPVGAEFVASNWLGYGVDDTFRIGTHLDSTGFTLLISGPQEYLNTVVLKKISPTGSVLIDDKLLPVPSAGKSAANFLESGTFVVVWEQWDYDYGSGDGIDGRAYAEDGSPLGDIFPVKSGTSVTPDVAGTDEARGFIVVWATAPNVMGRLYTLFSLFQDGFESGNLSAWSLSVGAS